MVSPVSSTSAMQTDAQHQQPKPYGLVGLESRVGEVMKAHETAIKDDISKALAPSSPVLNIPKPILDQFREWDKKFTKPEELRLIEAVKEKIVKMQRNDNEFVHSKVASDVQKTRLEFAMKAISKTTSGIQSLLQAQ